jgi:multidrug efflux pump subunit AcrB
MQFLVRFSMKNTLAIILLVLLLVGGGAYSIYLMKMEKYPNVDIPFLRLTSIYPGASPQQVMRDIGEPLEQQIRALDDVVNVYTYGMPNYMLSIVEFKLDADMQRAKQELESIASQVTLPDQAESIKVAQENPEKPDIYEAGLLFKNQIEAEKFVRQTVEPALKNIQGVESINISGVPDRKIEIRLSPAKMQKYKLSYNRIKQLIQANNINIPIGDLDLDQLTMPIRIDNKLQSIDEIRNIKITVAGAPVPPSKTPILQTITLGQIATIGAVSDSDTLTRVSGQPAIVIGIVPRGGEDAVQIAEQSKETLANLKMPADMKWIELSDQSIDIEKSVNTMLREVFLGAFMAMFVTLLFLRNLRSTLIAIISIPLSMFATFIILNWLGYTLNIMTLAGIAVAIGRVVDDSIVVIENIFRRLQKTQERNDELVEKATHEVAAAITSSTLTTVAVFLPLAFVSGIVGKFFIPLAWTVVVSLLFSLLVAITVVPLLSRIFLLKMKFKPHRDSLLQIIYRSTLKWTLRHKAFTVLFSILLLFASVIGFGGQLGFNFLPAEKIQKYTISIQLPTGTQLKATESVTKKVENILSRYKEINQKKVSSSIGAGLATISFVTKDDVEVAATKKLAKDLRNDFSKVKDAKSITLIGQGGPGDSNVSILINGPNIESIEKGASIIVEKLKTIKGLADVRSTSEGEKPEVSIVLDKNKLAYYGLTAANVSISLREMIDGVSVSTFDFNDQSTDIMLALNTAPINNLQDIGKQTITNALGQPIELNKVGKIVKVKNKMSVQHLNQKEFLQVNAAITDPNTGKVNTEMNKVLDSIKLPDGVTWEITGATEEMQKGFINIGIALAVGILLVFIVMLIAFGQALMPLVILASIPFSLIGALAGLYIVNEPIGMPAMIGTLMLSGIVVTNAIVLLEKVKQNLEAGMHKNQALIEAGVVRLRPILMTAIATICALLPLSWSTDAGLISQSLAVVVIGGLITSTFLTLFIVPVLYSALKRK